MLSVLEKDLDVRVDSGFVKNGQGFLPSGRCIVVKWLWDVLCIG